MSVTAGHSSGGADLLCGFRSDAVQARLFAANPNPKWVYATELDLGPPAAYAWLAANCQRVGFIKRYAWAMPLARRAETTPFTGKR